MPSATHLDTADPPVERPSKPGAIGLEAAERAAATPLAALGVPEDAYRVRTAPGSRR